MTVEKLTATERRLFQMFSDGEPHTKAELITCLNDELADCHAMQLHLTRMRPKIREQGLLVVTQYISGRVHYRMVRAINVSPNCE